MITTTVIILLLAIAAGWVIGTLISVIQYGWKPKEFPDMDLKVRPVEFGSPELETFSDPTWEQLEIDLRNGENNR